MADDDATRRTGFESILLSGIWLIARVGLGKCSTRDAMFWRADAIGYFDQYGRPGDEPKQFRRGTTFPPING